MSLHKEILGFLKQTHMEPQTRLNIIEKLCKEAELNEKPLVNENFYKDQLNMEGPSPTRTSYTGAVRSKLLAEGLRFDLLDSNDSAMRRLARVFALGFKKYGADNWKKGFPNSEYYAHAREHMLNYISNAYSDEDDLAHAVWNLMAIMWNEEHLPEMCDFPTKLKPDFSAQQKA